MTEDQYAVGKDDAIEFMKEFVPKAFEKAGENLRREVYQNSEIDSASKRPREISLNPIRSGFQDYGVFISYDLDVDTWTGDDEREIDAVGMAVEIDDENLEAEVRFDYDQDLEEELAESFNDGKEEILEYMGLDDEIEVSFVA